MIVRKRQWHLVGAPLPISGADYSGESAGWKRFPASHRKVATTHFAEESPSIDIIPVIDLKGGCVVHGIAGHRDEYLPIVSKLCDSPQPIAVATAFQNVFGLRRLYIADLDAIAGMPPSSDVYRELQQRGFSLLVDAGVREPADARRLLSQGIETIVVGLETISGPQALDAILQEHSDSKILFSLDLASGAPMGNRAAWNWRSPEEILDHVLSIGVNRILLLDLAHVGMGGGTGTDSLAWRAASNPAKRELIVGGGIRGIDDLMRLTTYGVDGVLVASALHDGRLTPEHVRRIATRPPDAT